MLCDFEKKIADYAKANGLVGPEQRLLLAVSGGVDSTALLNVMHALKAAGSWNCELLCAHLNHQLRGNDADLDEAFVADQAAKLNLSLIVKRLHVREYRRREKLSIETAARQLRMSALTRIAQEKDCHAIVTAHQKNDNAETVIQRLARGTGLRGLAGIWPVRVFADGTKLMRPLLCVGRDESISYLREKNIQWRLDRTNADYVYRRNFIRHRLLPELQLSAAHSIVEQLSELSESARRFYWLTCKRADKFWPEISDCQGDNVILDVGMFLSQPRPVEVELIRRSLAQIGCGEKDLAHGHYEKILQLADQNVSGRKMELPGGYVVCREYGRLIFGSRRKDLVGQPFRLRSEHVPTLSKGHVPPYIDDRSLTLNLPGCTRFDEYVIEATVVEATEIELEHFVAEESNWVERFDLERIELPLTVRFRRAGDRFIPLGMTSQKRLGKFLTDQRVPRRLREKVLVVADVEKIVWICPLRISEQARITNGTRKILHLQITKLEDRQNTVDTE
jgi:tRNA(Ile)-lysidine synthase